MKYLLVILALLVSSMAYGADITLRWDASIGAAGYKLYQSNDAGTTWGIPIDVGSVTQYTVTGVSDSEFIIWKISAYNSVGESVNHWQGAWYDGRKKPPSNTVGLGIK